MRTISRFAAAVLDGLTEGLGVGDSRKLDRGLGFMPVHVERLHVSPSGLLYSVAHYFERNGDLVPDPDVVFVHGAGGWSPVSYQDSLTYPVAVTFEEDGTTKVDELRRRDLVGFCNRWMKNIREQQRLSPRTAK